MAALLAPQGESCLSSVKSLVPSSHSDKRAFYSEHDIYSIYTMRCWTELFANRVEVTDAFMIPKLNTVS